MAYGFKYNFEEADLNKLELGFLKFTNLSTNSSSEFSNL